jgi:hypothetical protein
MQTPEVRNSSVDLPLIRQESRWLGNQKKTRRRIGRPTLPKKESKGKIVPVRFEPEDFKLVLVAAKAGNQTLSAWIRQALRTSAEV